MEKAFDDDVLGRLEYDEYLNWYAGEMALGEGRKLAVALSLDECEDLDDLIRLARGFVRDIARTDELARAYASEELLAVYNEVWSEGQDLIAAEFAARIALESLTAYPDRSVELCYDDGDLFWGHTIIVTAEEGPRFTEAIIAG